MPLPIVFMFSGQGSHYYQMGKELFEENKTFHDWMLKADHLYHDLTQLSVIDHLYSKENIKAKPFTQTLLTHHYFHGRICTHTSHA